MSTENGEHPARRHRSAVVAVAAAVVLAGGGGAWWAAAANGGDGGNDRPAPLRLAGQDRPAPATGGATAPYRLTGKLPGGPDRAPVYGTTGTVAASDVRHLASLLGVPGPVRAEHGSWRAGTGDGPTLLVGKAAPATWSYSRGGTPATGARSDATSAPGASPVSPAKAESVAAPVLKGLGLSGAKVDASVAVGAIRTVSADPRVGGLPTHGWTTSLEIGADGRTAVGYGRLSELAKGDTYPVVSAATALKELNAAPVTHPGGGPASCPAPNAPQSTTGGVNGGADPNGTGSADGSSSASGAGGASGKDGDVGSPEPAVPPCIPDGGTPQPTEVRGATFGLALEYVSGRQALVPAWLFATARPGAAHTSVVAQTAVDPSYTTPGPTGGATAVPPSPPASPPSVNPGGPERPTSPATPVSPASPASPPTGGTAHHVQVEGYTTAGRTLTLSYEGGLCDTYKASASESGGKVAVSIVATPKPKGTVCPMIIQTFTQKVTLAAPLGSRAVVDTSNGQPVHAGRASLR